MVEFLLKSIPVLVLVSHLLLLGVFVSLIFANSWGKSIAFFIGDNSMKLGILVVLFAVLGSLFYSNIAGFTPCVLCWWQRVFIFPILVVLLVGFLKKNNSAFMFVFPLALLGALVALYQSYVYLGGSSILPCTAEGGECGRVYVLAFGYITIPLMSLTASLYILAIAWARKIYENNNNA